MQKQIVGLIPIKANSDRIKSKNLRPFADTNLYELKLSQIKRVQGFSRVVISSEDEGVLKIAQQYGFDTHLRDPKYSTSHVPMSEVYSYIAGELNEEHIAWINATNPLAETELYEGAIEAYQQLGKQYDCLLSVYKLQDYIFYQGKPVNFKPYPWPRSQDLEGMFSMSFVINLLRREDMVRWGSCVGNHPYLYEMDSVSSTDIDFAEDFEFCEMVYRKRQVQRG